MTPRALTCARAGAVAVVLALLAAAWRLGLYDQLAAPKAFAHGLVAMGGWGYLAFVLAYTVLQPFGVPGTVFVVAAPLIWPWQTAFALSMAGTMSASVVGFSFARFVARDWVSARIPARLRRHDEALEAHAFETVVLLRLIFWMPQALHFFFGVSRVGFWTHVWGSLLGYVPPLSLVSYLGGELFDEAGRLQPRAWPIMGALIALSLVVAALARARARRRSPHRIGASPMEQDLAGKVFLVTGATDGIGKAAATNFARRGAAVTLVGRNREKSEQVLAELRAASGNEHLELLLCDLSRMADVKRAADTFKARHDRLDVLVNNAGATFKAPVLGPEGVELTFALNHLAYFQLTTSLLDLLEKTPGARVVSTSSAMQARGRLDLATTPTSLEGSGPGAYATSKLANVLFTKELQRRLAGTTATANCFEPGMVATRFGGFGSDQGLLLNLVYTLARPFAVTPEQGADSLIWLATAPEAAALKGEYVSKRRPATPQKQALDAKLAADLWSLSEKLCAAAVARAA
ncbi:MAG: SDR family NAD(P)-dependent oxidoreductase [Anaeromyxobacteraceae bacterium]